MPPPPMPGSMDSEDGESKDEEDSGEDEDGKEVQNEHVIKQPPRAIVERLLIPQPKGIGSLGLKQLGCRAELE